LSFQLSSLCLRALVVFMATDEVMTSNKRC
jgi:hypothetical protein